MFLVLKISGGKASKILHLISKIQSSAEDGAKLRADQWQSSEIP